MLEDFDNDNDGQHLKLRLDDEISECEIINIMIYRIKSTQEFRGANMKIIDTNYIRPVSLGKSRQSIARVYHLLLKGVFESYLKKTILSV
jgi:hypothetical protein